MKLEIILNAEPVVIDLAGLEMKNSGIVFVGQKCKQVWNEIAIDSPEVDPFQCTLMAAGDTWSLSHGQTRTECPKGLVSDKLIPCRGCMGRCVNIHPGRPKYPKREPATSTLVNGTPVADNGTTLAVGDVITFGSVTIKVR